MVVIRDIRVEQQTLGASEGETSGFGWKKVTAARWLPDRWMGWVIFSYQLLVASG